MQLDWSIAGSKSHLCAFVHNEEKDSPMMEDTCRSSGDWRLFFSLKESDPNFRSNLKTSSLFLTHLFSFFTCPSILGLPLTLPHFQQGLVPADEAPETKTPRASSLAISFCTEAKFYCSGVSLTGRHGHVAHWLAKWWPHQISPTFPQSLPWEKRCHSSLSPLALASLCSPTPHFFNWRLLRSRSESIHAFLSSTKERKTNSVPDNAWS